jgi:hypothetical protein
MEGRTATRQPRDESPRLPRCSPAACSARKEAAPQSGAPAWDEWLALLLRQLTPSGALQHGTPITAGEPGSHK